MENLKKGDKIQKQTSKNNIDDILQQYDLSVV